MDEGSTSPIENIINLPNHNFPQYRQVKAFPDFDVLKTNCYEDPRDYHLNDLAAARDTFPSPGSLGRPQTPDPHVPLAAGQRSLEAKHHHQDDRKPSRDKTQIRQEFSSGYITHDHGSRLEAKHHHQDDRKPSRDKTQIRQEFSSGYITHDHGSSSEDGGDADYQRSIVPHAYPNVTSPKTPTPAPKTTRAPSLDNLPLQPLPPPPPSPSNRNYLPSLSGPPQAPTAAPMIHDQGSYHSLSSPSVTHVTPTQETYYFSPTMPPARAMSNLSLGDHPENISLSAPPATAQALVQPTTPVESSVNSASSAWTADAEPHLEVTVKLIPVKAKDLEGVRHWKGVGEEGSIKFPPVLASFHESPPTTGDVFTYQSSIQKKTFQAWIFRGNPTAHWNDITKFLTEHLPMINHPTAKGFCLWLRDDYTPNYIKHDTYKNYVAKLK